VLKKERTRKENVGTDKTGTGKLIVVVDDEDYIRRFTIIVLKRSGYEVREAADGEQTIQLVADLCHDGHLPDLIITDVDMPNVDGVRMARILATDPVHGKIPILFVSGYLKGYSLEDLKPYGGHFLPKPFEFEELRRAVYGILAETPKEPAA
jgi:CheY-like chemotaxis protein